MADSLGSIKDPLQHIATVSVKTSGPSCGICCAEKGICEQFSAQQLTEVIGSSLPFEDGEQGH